jgi:Bacterial Ig-like domain (group 2)
MRRAFRWLAPLLLACAREDALKVTDPCPTIGLGLTPGSITIAIGDTARLRFPAQYWCGRVIPEVEPLIWNIANTLVATVDSAGAVRGLSVGQTTVLAAVARDRGMNASASVTVR